MRRDPCIVTSRAPQDRGENGRDGAGAKRVRHGGAGEGGCGEERQSAIAEGKERDHEKWQRASAHNFTSAEIAWGWPPWCRVEGKSEVIFHICLLSDLEFVLKLTKETINLPLSCLQAR